MQRNKYKKYLTHFLSSDRIQHRFALSALFLYANVVTVSPISLSGLTYITVDL